MSNVIADMRRDYTLAGLDVADVLPDPVQQFRRWFDDARTAGLPEPNAMHLATVDVTGKPAGRIVLLKEVDDTGFVFYTNYESRKGHELAAHPVAALTFFFVELERQIRVEGTVEKVSAADSDAYFAIRPRGSQIGAWVSHQSDAIASREVLEQRQRELEAQFAGQDIPRPPHWGGYRVVPTSIEFWQGRPSRLHDRIQFTKEENGSWQIARLSP